MRGLVFKSPAPAGIHLGNFAPDASSFTFVQVTDIHMAPGRRTELSYLREDLAQIASSAEFDFLVATGDLTDTTSSVELAECVKGLSEVKKPVFPLPGNHDTYDREVGTQYIDAFGPRWYSFDWGPVHFIVYDSIRENDTAPQREWLVRHLEEQPSDRPIVLLTHFQLNQSFYDLFKGHNVVASVSGHWHTSRVWFDGRITHFNGPSLSFGGIDYSPRAFRVFRWESGKLGCRTHALGANAKSALAGAAFRPAGAPGIISSNGRLADADGNWPQLGGSPQRTPKISAVDQGAYKKITGLQAVWSAQLPGVVNLASPVTADGRLFIGTMFEDAPGMGGVTCLDAATGEQIWTRGVGDSVKNSLAIANGLVIGVTVSGRVFALDAASGDEVWHRQLGDPSMRWIFHSPLVADDRVYVGSPNHFAAYDAATGKVRWTREDLGASDWISSYSSPTLADGVLIAGFLWQRSGLVGLDPDTGKTLWLQEGKPADSAVSTPIASGAYAWVIRHKGAFQCLRARSGELVWEYQTGAGWSPAAAALDERKLYVADGRGGLHALDRNSGELVWQWQSPQQLLDMGPYSRGRSALLAAPLIRGEQVLVASLDGKIHIIDRDTGNAAGAWDAGFPLASGPVPYGEAVLQTDTGGRLHALVPDA